MLRSVPGELTVRECATRNERVTDARKLFRARSLLRASHLDEKSAFRPCGRELVEFFKSTGWAFYGHVILVRSILADSRTQFHDGDFTALELLTGTGKHLLSDERSLRSARSSL